MIEVEYEEGKNLAKNFVCAECEGELTCAWGGFFGINKHVVYCFNDKDHQGFLEKESITKVHRRGGLIPSYMADRIEGKLMVNQESVSRMMNLVAVKYPKAIVDKATAALFVMDCLRLGLDPLLKEAIPIPFTGKDGKKVVEMIITEDGYLSMAARGCPELWGGPPKVEPVTDPALKKEVCGEEDAWVWKATGRTKGMEPGQESIAYGWVKKKEKEKGEQAGTPIGELPGNQARVRAVKRWVRENFPQARHRMMELTAEWMERADGLQEAIDFIDAEYRVLGTPELPATQRAGESKKEAVALEKKSERRDPSTIKNRHDFYNACFQEFGLQPKDALRLAGYSSELGIADWGDAYQQVRAKR